MLPPIIKGMISRPTRKALVRTAAKYSRAAMTRILCTVALPGVALRCTAIHPGDPDENVLQGGSGQFKVVDPTSVQKQSQDLLGVGSGSQTQFLPTAKVGGLHHAGKVGQRDGRLFEVNPYRIVPV